MRQSYPDIEHIIVDGASSDHSLSEIRGCGSPRIVHLVSEKDSGCYEALNKGVRLATGDIVGWLHSDDVYFSDDVVAEVVRQFEETDCELLYADGIYVSAENPDWVIRSWISGRFTDRKMAHGWLPLHTTVFVRRELFERYSYYSEQYTISGDTFWLLRLMYRTGIRVHYLPRYVVRMSYGGLSTSLSSALHHWREDLGIYKQIGMPPRLTLLKKVLRKVPQFLMAPFVRC